MNRLKNTLTTLKNEGERITIVRREIVKIFASTSVPLSAFEIQKLLEKKRIRANKTTIYRQMAVLQKYKIVHEVRFGDRTVRYEFAKKDDHHHHLVCVRCKKVEDINFKDDVERQEKIITQKTHFKVLRHSLEFFGLCKVCQQKK